MTPVDLRAVEQRVTASVSGWDDEDVAVRVSADDDRLHVTVTSRHPSTHCV